MLSPHHGAAVGHIRLWAHALLHSDIVIIEMATRRISLIPHKLRFHKRAMLHSDSVRYWIATLCMSLIPHQLCFLIQTRGIDYCLWKRSFVNLAFRGIRCISCPFQWFQFGENRTSTVQDMIKRVMMQWCCPPHHGGAVGHIRLRAHTMLHSDSVTYGMATCRMLLIPHQLRFWYKLTALTSVSGSAHFVNLAFRGIRCLSCPFQWFQFGENQTSTAQDMIKRVMVLSWWCPWAHSFVSARIAPFWQCNVLNGKMPHVVDTTSTSFLVETRGIDFC